MSNKRLIKSTGIIGIATLLSRVFGFIRDILIAGLFGTSNPATAFIVAFRIPNLLRDLVGEGASNAAFVPVLTDYHTKRTNEEFWLLARNLFWVLFAALSVITLAGVLLAPIIVKMIAVGLVENKPLLEFTIRLTRIMFPFVLLVGLIAYGTGVLNSLNHFAAPAFGPVLLNVAMIAFLIYVCPTMGATGLALSVLAGGALQVAILWPVLYKKGFRIKAPKGYVPKEKTGINHPAIKRIWKLLIPRMFGSAVYQLSAIVDSIFSTFQSIVGLGAPAALWYSFRLFHFPLAIFGISLATAALPKMSKEVAQNDMPLLKNTINFSMRSVFLVLLPATVGLATMGKAIIRVIFERGEFTAYSALITNNALFFYAFGLVSCGAIKILVSAFFALGDTKTPVKTAAISLLLNIILNFALMWRLKIGGIALATSISATVNFLMLYMLLGKRIGDLGTRRILNSFLRMIFAGTCMGIFAYFASEFLCGLNVGTLGELTGLLSIIGISIVIYVSAALIIGLGEIKELARWILKKG